MTSSISTYYEHLTSTRDKLSKMSQSSEPEPTILPPLKNMIRQIQDDPLNRREKYDGYRWRLVCTWQDDQCTNLAYTCQLCPKHNALRKDKPTRKRKKQNSLLPNSVSLPATLKNRNKNKDSDNDIEFIGIFRSNKQFDDDLNSAEVKRECKHYQEFAIDFENTDNSYSFGRINEPRASSSTRTHRNGEIEYVGTKNTLNSVNVTESIKNHIPPLTDFEEDYLANQLLQTCPSTSTMLDGQLFLHDIATSVVQKNYRIKMDTINQDYFYDFLLRHPNIALHFKHWFVHCKPLPPNTGSHIDTKIWTLVMMIRGTTVDRI